MTAPVRNEQDLPQLLAQLVPGTRPDYRDHLVEATARTPQRPVWTFPGRWLPMDITAQRVAPAHALRVPLMLLILAALAAAALVGLAVASRPNLPAPFGPAGNGRIVYGSGGDLFVLDPGSTTPRMFLADPAVDTDPLFSNQGDRVLFARAGNTLWIVDADGRNPRPLTGPLVGLSSYSWSPDGSMVAVAHDADGFPKVSIYRADGSGGRVLDLGIAVADPVWRPGHGSQLLVRGQAIGPYDLYLVDTATAAGTGTGRGTPMRLGIPHERGGPVSYDGQRASWSTDGTTLVFEQGLARVGASGWQVIRLVAADVAPDGTMSNVRHLELDPASDYEYLGRWLANGDEFAFAQQKACTWQVYVTTGLDVANARAVGEPFKDCTNRGIDFELSPDATRVVTVRATADDAEPMWIGGADGTGRVKLDGTTTDRPSWQRVAP